MGKISDLAYNIGTSLNADDINTHRQTITPTAQTLQNLSTDDRLVHHTNNQAILDGNKEQLEREMESGDGFWNYDGDWRGKTNAQLAKETREFMSDEEALIIKDVLSIALPALDALELLNKYENAKTDKEKQAVLASILEIPTNKAGKLLKAIKSGKKPMQ
ncbi:hypothetical protein [Moraxella marmotae]|uniref:hypothetical protein n=1 Tax=Moraxella marmotae TaxID=3344520 RepID=UPI0035F2CE86